MRRIGGSTTRSASTRPAAPLDRNRSPATQLADGHRATAKDAINTKENYSRAECGDQSPSPVQYKTSYVVIQYLIRQPLYPPKAVRRTPLRSSKSMTFVRATDAPWVTGDTRTGRTGGTVARSHRYGRPDLAQTSSNVSVRRTGFDAAYHRMPCFAKYIQ